MSWVLVSENRPFLQMTDCSTGLAGTIVHAPSFICVCMARCAQVLTLRRFNSIQTVQNVTIFAVNYINQKLFFFDHLKIILYLDRSFS